MKLSLFSFKDSMHWPVIVVAHQSYVIKQKVKKKKIYLPTYPKFFSLVTRSKQFIFLGLNMFAFDFV